ADRDAGRRYQAGLMRRFGAELYNCGCPAVIVLPTLSGDLSVKVFEVLQQYVIKEVSGPRRWWEAPRPLYMTVRKMQEVVAAGYDDQEASLEAAFDLTLYAIDDFSLNVQRSDAAETRA
ncbi:MAG TPA: hypothetical protein VJZ91_06430, partial [Blastocatellia bacterium]|nr:hypothetical protein [Blastocatellia bacterium]